MIHSKMTVGELVAITMYLGPLYQPLQRLSELNLVLANGIAALARIFDLMDQPARVKDHPNAMHIERARGAVEFRSVWFEYRPGKPVLEDINISVRPGQTIALVGQSGSGKSTITKLLLRFYDVTSGCILLDGIDIRNISLRSLRRQIGLVMQEPLLSGTIRENILYGNPAATERQLIEAARMANCLDFVLSLPNGFDTEVGERGCHLSARQRQRLTIARAFVKDPAILILDEATSSLDPESEHLVNQALRCLTAGRTTFVIAHRLATVVNADWIIVLEAGRVVEQGTHEQLLTKSRIFAKLISRQTEHTASTVVARQQQPLRSYRAVGS
ncbi:MAG: ABC transporter ATP-binding protein [Sedimentisphaerales bacterium]|nr:ABC transporter ATP-binding protein [Sedimentisphaerales bacterium]